MYYFLSPAIYDIFDIIETSSKSGYNFTAPEIIN